MDRYHDDDEDEAGAVCGQPSPERSGVAFKEGKGLAHVTLTKHDTKDRFFWLTCKEKKQH